MLTISSFDKAIPQQIHDIQEALYIPLNPQLPCQTDRCSNGDMNNPLHRMDGCSPYQSPIPFRPARSSPTSPLSPVNEVGPKNSVAAAAESVPLRVMPVPCARGV